jgi:hypothetical protein
VFRKTYTERDNGSFLSLVFKHRRNIVTCQVDTSVARPGQHDPEQSRQETPGHSLRITNERVQKMLISHGVVTDNNSRFAFLSLSNISMQKIRLDIPIEPYLLCMTRFAMNSPEYIKLKNGVVLRDANGNEIVEILCEHDRAKKILEMVAQLCPEAFPQIQPRLDCSDTSEPQQSVSGRAAPKIELSPTVVWEMILKEKKKRSSVD